MVLHRGRAGLTLARPAVALAWALTTQQGREYVAGWAGGGELHLLTSADDHAAAAVYARHAVDAALPPRLGRLRGQWQWAWLLEGASRWFAGQTEQMGKAISRRLREGSRPSFPPGVRDAVLLGGTVIDLLAREEGEAAAAEFAAQLHPGGSRAALTEAFGGRPFRQTEDAWRSHLRALSGSARSRAR